MWIPGNEINGPSHALLKLFDGGNYLIRRENEHDRVRIDGEEMQGSQCEAGGGVSGIWFDIQIGVGKFREMFPGERRQRLAGDDMDAIGGNQRPAAVERLLNERTIVPE